MQWQHHRGNQVKVEDVFYIFPVGKSFSWELAA